MPVAAPLEVGPDQVVLLMPPGGTAGRVRITVGESITGDTFDARVRRTAGKGADVIGTFTFATVDATAGVVDMVITAAQSRAVADGLAVNAEGASFREGWWLLTRRVDGAGDPLPLAEGPVRVRSSAPA